MSKDIGRETLLNASPISKTGLVLAQPLDISNPDADISKLYKSLCLPVVDNHIFEIGEKCFVGGTRSGVVAYVGETHFAPGEWIGVVLDEPSGKNDGCVSGKRYFQCDQKRGVFSRANRLTLSPIEVPKRNLYDIDSYENNQFRRSVSPSPSISSTTCKTPNRVREIQVGDRVIVSSGFGSRLGVLKFIGETKFAAGNWCGVQLDEPNGKNDGSIDGVKYFDCPSKYGVFVPIAKVSVSPSTRKSTLSRAGSKESLGSVGTLNSVATTNTSRLRMSRLKKPTASSLGMIPQNSSHKIMSKSTYSMQDLIREKQQHIEKLMKERELDRDDLHNQILFFQKTICELNEKINILEIKLNDSERKNDELQNTVDDVTFCGDELNIQNQECRENIEILQKILIQHGIEFEPFIHSTTTNTCLKCINYSKKVEELSANLTNLKTEIENQKSNNNKSISETDFIAKEDELYKKELKISELENVIITLKHEKEIREIDLEDFKIQIETLNINKLEEINHTKTLVNDLKTGNANLQNKKISNDEKFLMEDQIHFLKKKIKDKQSEIENLKLGQENGALEITSMKKNFEKLVQEIQSKENYLKESQHKCDLLTNLLNDAKQQNKSDENELQNIIEKNIEKIKTYNEKEFESIKTFETLNIEKDNALKKNEEIATKLFELTGKIETLENELKGKESELSILQQNYETIKTQKLDLYNENIQYQSKIFQNNQKLDSLSQEVQHLKLALDKSNVEYKKLEDSCNTTQNLLTETTLSKDKNICVLEDNINILTSENKNLSKSNIELNEIIKCLQDSQTSYKEKLNHKMLELTASIEEKESYVKELRHKTEQLEVLMTEIAQSKLLLEEKTKTLSEMEKKNLLFEQNTNDLLEKIQDLKLKQFETQNILTKELNDSKFNNEMLTQSLNDLQRKMQEESDVIKTKDVKIINLISQLKNLEIKLASSIKRKESGDDELKKLAIEMNKGDVESKEIQLIEKEKKIEDLGQTIQNLQHEKLNLEKNGHELKKKVEHSYALNKELQCQINDFTNQMKKLHEQIDVVTNDKNLSEKIIIEVKKQLVNLQIEKETLQNSLKNLHIIQENTEKRSKEIDDCMSKKEFDLCEKNKKIHNLQSEIFRLMDKLNEVQNNFENLSNNFEAQKHEIDFSENKIKNLEKILEKERGSLNNKTIEIEELKFELKNLTEQNETLNGRLILNTQSKIELINKIEQVEKNLNLTEQKLKLAENLNQLNLTKLKENSLELGVAKESQKKAKILEQEQNNEISFLTKKICELTEIKSATDESFNQMKIKISEVEKEKQCIFDQNEKLQAINSNSNVLDEEHENLKDQLKTKSLELEKVLEAYKVEKSENKNIAKMYREETEDLNKKIKFCEKEIFELQQHNMNLTQEKLQLERRYLIEQKPDSEDIKNLKDELLKEKDNYLILSNKYQKLIVDLRTLENSYKILQDLEQKTLDLQHINDMLHEENYKMKHDIGKVELQKQDAINNAELLEFKNGKEVEKYKQLTIHSQEEATNLHKQIKIKDKELSDITYLYEISHKNILEKAVHNEKLEKEIQTLKNSIVNTDYISKNSAAQISSNIISDSDAADQINFLNSIIADMHRTNETLKARIDVLETNPADISKHFNLDILNKRKPTPRLFCDICDEFDKHDTEYCPLQSSDSPPSSLSNINNLTIQNDKVNKRVILSPREYCENCEIFGHDTSSCPNVECF